MSWGTLKGLWKVPGRGEFGQADFGSSILFVAYCMLGKALCWSRYLCQRVSVAAFLDLVSFY